MQEEEKINEIIKNPAIVNGKAQRFTILHTSDIHGQLDIHDEFFYENGKPVYKKRVGFATLQTMFGNSKLILLYPMDSDFVRHLFQMKKLD